MHFQQNAIDKPQNKYYNRDDFKRDLELKIGHYVDINLWLQARPKRPFPWANSDLEESFLYVKKAEQGIWAAHQR
jgi:hypothetical protein